MTDWRSESFRDNIVAKLNGHIGAVAVPLRTDARQMEANIFHKARSEHEYMAYIARLIVYIRDKSKSEAAKASPQSDESSSVGALSNQTNDDDDTDDDDDDAFSDAAKKSTTKAAPPPPPAHHYNPTRAPTKADAGSSIGESANRRAEPTASQRLDILRTAIATVLQNPGWRSDATAAVVRPQIALFGQYVAARLAQIAADGDEELLVVTQQQLMAVLNKAV